MTWFSLAPGDAALPTHGMTDGDTYDDGQSFAGLFRYGTLGVAGLEVPDCGACIVSHAVKLVPTLTAWGGDRHIIIIGRGLHHHHHRCWSAPANSTNSSWAGTRRAPCSACRCGAAGPSRSGACRTPATSGACPAARAASAAGESNPTAQQLRPCSPSLTKSSQIFRARRYRLADLLRGRDVLSLSLDREQAHSPSERGVGPSSVLFGKLHLPSERYEWTRPIPKGEHDWVVELQLSAFGPGGESSPRPYKTLVDTGCSHFKANARLGAALRDAWGFQLANGECPERSSLRGCGVRVRVGGAEFDVAAQDLVLKVDPDVEDGGRQCNRITVCGDAVTKGKGEHEAVFGMAILAAWESVAWDFAERRVGFAARHAKCAN
jgi:hypothetical protein